MPDRRNCYRSQPLADQAAPALPGIRLPAHLQSAEPAMIWTNGDVSQFPGRARQWSAAGHICPWQRKLRDHPEAIFSVFREDPVRSASLTATGFEPCAERPYRCRLHCDRWSPSLLINGSSWRVRTELTPGFPFGGSCCTMRQWLVPGLPTPAEPPWAAAKSNLLAVYGRSISFHESLCQKPFAH